MPIGIARIDLDGVIVAANDAFAQLHRRANRGLPTNDLLAATKRHPTIHDAIRTALAGQPADVISAVSVGEESSVLQIRARPLEVDGEAVGAIITVDDIPPADVLP